MARPKSQRDRRRYQHFRDQHGRRWGAVVEKDSGDSTGPIQAIGWEPPDPRLLPPQAYLHSIPDELGMLQIDYDDWEAKTRLAIQDYEERKEMMAVAMYGAQASAALKDPPAELLRQIGVATPQAWQPIRAMKRGHLWALLGVGERPAWADLYLPAIVKDTRHDEAFLEEDKTFTPEERKTAEAQVEARLRKLVDRAADSITEVDPCVYCGKDAVMTTIVNGQEQPVCKDCVRITDARDATALDDEHDPDGVGGRTIPARRAPNRSVKKAARPAHV
jgi:hypothetical protein